MNIRVANLLDADAVAAIYAPIVANTWTSFEVEPPTAEEMRDRIVSTLQRLARLGYFQAFAGIALPNAASAALHESVGFRPLGIYRNVGHKLGAWRDVGWWQRALREVSDPTTPQVFQPETFR